MTTKIHKICALRLSTKSDYFATWFACEMRKTHRATWYANGISFESFSHESLIESRAVECFMNIKSIEFIGIILQSALCWVSLGNLIKMRSPSAAQLHREIDIFTNNEGFLFFFHVALSIIFHNTSKHIPSASPNNGSGINIKVISFAIFTLFFSRSVKSVLAATVKQKDIARQEGGKASKKSVITFCTLWETSAWLFHMNNYFTLS